MPKPGWWSVPRRAGKSWLAAAIARARPDGRTQRIDLRDSVAAVRRAGLGCLRGANMPPAVSGDVLLVDEPCLDGGDWPSGPVLFSGLLRTSTTAS